MRKYLISDRFTTADIGLELEADSLGELFTAGAEGMFAIIFEPGRTGEIPTRKSIELEAPNPEQLLVDWLSELLYLFDAEGIIASEFDLDISIRNSKSLLRATVGFRNYNRECETAQHEVKAVTYYKLNIEKDGEIYRCHVVFDL